MPFPKRAVAHRKEKDAPMSLMHVAKKALPALLFTLLLGLLLLSITAAILLKTKDPAKYAQGAGLAVLYLSALAGGFVCTLLYGRRTPLLCGLVLGTALFSLTLALSFLLPQAWQGEKTLAATLPFRALLIPASCAGAFLAVQRKKRPRRRRR